MAVYLARSCPKCRNYFGVVIAQPEGREKAQPVNGRCAVVVTRSTGYSFQVMAQSGVDKIPPGPKLINVTINFSKLVLRIRPRRVTK